MGGAPPSSAGLATAARSPNRTPLRALPTLVRRLRIICSHTEYVDKLDTVLDTFGRLKVPDTHAVLCVAIV
jgi:hypothetical protein